MVWTNDDTVCADEGAQLAPQCVARSSELVRVRVQYSSMLLATHCLTLGVTSEPECSVETASIAKQSLVLSSARNRWANPGKSEKPEKI